MVQDTRKDPRARVLSMTVRYKSATIEEFIEHHSHDVSRGGMFIKTPSPFPAGTLLKFEVRIAEEKKVIQGVGRVVWKRDAATAESDHPAGMGVKFIKIDDDSKQVIDRLVAGRGGGESAFEKGERESTPKAAASVSAIPRASSPTPVPAPTSVSNRPTRKGTMIGLGAITPSEPASEPTDKFFPDSPPAEEPAPEDRTVMKQAAELLQDALREAGGSMEEVTGKKEPVDTEATADTSASDEGRDSGEAQPADLPPIDERESDAEKAEPKPESKKPESKKPESKKPESKKPVQAQPTSKPAGRARPSSIPPKEEGGGSAIWLLAGVVAIGGGIFYISQQNKPEPPPLPPPEPTETQATAQPTFTATLPGPAAPAQTADAGAEAGKPDGAAAAAAKAEAEAKEQAEAAARAEAERQARAAAARRAAARRAAETPKPKPKPKPTAEPTPEPTPKPTATGTSTDKPPTPPPSATPTAAPTTEKPAPKPEAPAPTTEKPAPAPTESEPAPAPEKPAPKPSEPASPGDIELK